MSFAWLTLASIVKARHNSIFLLFRGGAHCHEEWGMDNGHQSTNVCWANLHYGFNISFRTLSLHSNLQWLRCSAEGMNFDTSILLLCTSRILFELSFSIDTIIFCISEAFITWQKYRNSEFGMKFGYMPNNVKCASIFQRLAFIFIAIISMCMLIQWNYRYWKVLNAYSDRHKCNKFPYRWP